MENKEQIYDTKIHPLMEQIIAICQEEKIPMFCEFQFSDEEFCKTYLNPKHTTVLKHYLRLSDCKVGNTVDIDSYLLWVLKHHNCDKSMFLGKTKVNLSQNSPDAQGVSA